MDDKIVNIIVRVCEFRSFAVILKSILFALSVDPFTYVVLGTVNSINGFDVTLLIKAHRRRCINLTPIFDDSICAKGILSENTQ